MEVLRPRLPVNALHVRKLGREVMNPDVQVVEQRNAQCGQRREPQGWNPEQEETVDIHAVARKAEDSFAHERPRSVALIEMVYPECAPETEVALHRVEQVHRGNKGDESEELECTRVRRQRVLVRNGESKYKRHSRNAENREPHG